MTHPATAPPRLFDRVRLARNRDRAAARFDEYAFLKARVSSDLIERLFDTSHTFSRALDLGTHTGELAALLQRSGKATDVLATDVSAGMVAVAEARGLNAEVRDEETLGLSPGTVDLVMSALSLHWVNDLPGTLIQIRQALKPDGLFLAAMFGAGTLKELRQCLLQAETDLTGGVSPRLSPLPTLADMAGLLQRAGFALPVADRETVTVRYDTMFALLRDMKGMGERASFVAGTTRPLSRQVLMRAAQLYNQSFADADGRIRASFEIVYLSGWAPAPTQPKPLKPGSAKVSLAQAVRQQRDQDG